MATKETAQRIMDAALQLISEKGYTAATTKAIADLAQVNEVTIFRHFGNKEGLLKNDCRQIFLQPNFAKNNA
ncbi:TetR family transcriptional regulator OS=Lysinibacillus sphaericus OX=1421 GN=LS41612_14115 PE=4 SV=1 [Lysinibacillus sphaericus]